MAFVVAGHWRPLGGRAADGAPSHADTLGASCGDGAGGGDRGTCVDDGNQPAPREHEEVTGGELNWPAYHAVWDDAPIDEAITAMFAEIAVLYAQI